ncbi:MAG: hypothetical protein ACOC5D_02440 [Thermoplasmatota archaeon]
MRKKQNDNTQLVEDSHYRIKSLSTRDELLTTSGYFKGYIQLGRGQALKMELDEDNEDEEGKTRIIPCHMITSIDIIQEAEPKTEEDKKRSSYHG